MINHDVLILSEIRANSYIAKRNEIYSFLQNSFQPSTFQFWYASGSTGYMSINKPEYPVVSSLLFDGSKVLLLKRSQKVGSFQGYWSCISGYIEQDELPLDTAIREIQEETRIPSTEISLIQQNGPRFSGTEEVIFKSFWFFFKVKKDHAPILIDWEHDEFIWIEPRELKNFQTVPWIPSMIESFQMGK